MMDENERYEVAEEEETERKSTPGMGTGMLLGGILALASVAAVHKVRKIRQDHKEKHYTTVDGFDGFEDEEE